MVSRGPLCPCMSHTCAQMSCHLSSLSASSIIESLGPELDPSFLDSFPRPHLPPQSSQPYYVKQ